MNLECSSLSLSRIFNLNSSESLSGGLDEGMAYNLACYTHLSWLLQCILGELVIRVYYCTSPFHSLLLLGISSVMSQ